MHQPKVEKVTALVLQAKKAKGEKITAVTAYDYPTSLIAAEAGIDIILVGDSLGMVVQGLPNTLPVTMEDILYHTRLVTRAQPCSLVISDMPFQSYHINCERSVENAIRCVKEGGAEAIKLEGGRRRFAVIEAILQAEIPVMAHLGLTPQSIHRFGGYKVQGKLGDQAKEILADAIELEKIGVFAILLESIPMELAQKVSSSLKIPTIGIGAGRFCDGQILVFHDLIGLPSAYLPKFVRKYADSHALWLKALQEYSRDVHSGQFPGDAESYHLNKDIEELLK